MSKSLRRLWTAVLLCSVPLASHATLTGYSGIALVYGGQGQLLVVGGNTAVMAPEGCVIPGSRCAVTLYQLVDGVWTEQYLLNPPSDAGNAYGNLFGLSLAVSSDGNTVFVGDPSTPCASAPTLTCGAIYVYHKPVSGWADMQPSAVLRPATTAGNAIGGVIAFDGTGTLAVLAGADVDVFLMPAGGWTDAAPNAVLSGATDGFFTGKALVNDGDVIAAALGADEIYLFVKPAGGWANASTPTATLTNTGPGSFGNQGLLGSSLAMDGGVIVAGVPGDNAALVFVEPAGGWTNMNQTAVLTPTDFSTLGMAFGGGVAIQGNTIEVSTLKHGLYEFQKPSTGWADAGAAWDGITHGYEGVAYSGNDVVLQISCLYEDCEEGEDAEIFSPTGAFVTPSSVTVDIDPTPSRLTSNSPTAVVPAGSPVRFDVNLGDLGPFATAGYVTLTLTLPAGVSRVSLNDTGCSIHGQQAICTTVGDTTATLEMTTPAKRTAFTVSAVADVIHNWDEIDNKTSLDLIADHPPVAQDLILSVAPGASLTGNVGATDADGDRLSYTVTSEPSSGTLNFNASTGAFTWHPGNNPIITNAGFTYQVSDGLLSVTHTVDIEITSMNTGSGSASGGGGTGLVTLLGLLGLLSWRRPR